MKLQHEHKNKAFKNTVLLPGKEFYLSLAILYDPDVNESLENTKYENFYFLYHLICLYFHSFTGHFSR